MTDSTVSVSPQSSSPYRSRIQARLASPLSASSSTAATFRNRTNDERPVPEEKVQLRKLNDQFLSYIERVRLFETYNHCLTIHSEQIENSEKRIETKFNLIKQEFEEYQDERIQKEHEEIEKENKQTKQIERQVDELKAKKNFFEQEHDHLRKRIVDLQRKTIDVQGETEQLRFDYENLTEDNNHYRRHLSFYQSFKSSIIDEINRQKDLTQRIEIEVEDLKIQKQLRVQSHEADIQAVQIHHDNVLCDLTSNFRLDSRGKSFLNEALNEIRQEYKLKDQQMRDEFHRKYLQIYNQQMRKNVENKNVQDNREEFNRRQLTNELNALNENRTILREKISALEQNSRQIQTQIDREIQRRKQIQSKYDDQIDQLRSNIRDYENLVNENSSIRCQTLKDEVDKYRRLLEGSEEQVGLKQLVEVGYRNEENPSSIAEKTSRRFIKSRENSNSETSFDTAPVTSVTTTQQYLTMNSIVESGLASDGETQNDRTLSARTSRLNSETDIFTTKIEEIPMPPIPPREFLDEKQNLDDDSSNKINIDQTLPFTTSNSVEEKEIELISDGQQSPIISTLEKRQDEDKTLVETEILVDKEKEEKSIIPIILPSIEEESSTSQIEIPITNTPLAKLISNILPNAAPFVPSSTLNQSNAANPSSTMNNDAPAFVPAQQQNNFTGHSNHWQNRNASNSGNRRGQGNFQNVGFHQNAGNQRSSPSNWQQNSSSHQKQRRGGK